MLVSSCLMFTVQFTGSEKFMSWLVRVRSMFLPVSVFTWSMLSYRVPIPFCLFILHASCPLPSGMQFIFSTFLWVVVCPSMGFYLGCMCLKGWFIFFLLLFLLFLLDSFLVLSLFSTCRCWA